VYLLKKGPIRVTTTVSALRPSGAASPKEAVDTLVSMLSDDMAAVDQLIHQHMDSTVGLIPNLASYLIEAGGKRLRPMLTLATAKLFGGGGAAPRKLAAAVEFIHSATLLHDDVVDGSDLRRGKKAANHVWGDKASVLVGDFLFARAFNMMVEAGSLAILDVLAKASSVIAEGEVMQLAAANDAGVTRERYMAIVEAKTAALFSAATRAGALAAGQAGTSERAMEVYGLELGLAFQLVDDALDYGGMTADLGKNVGDDFREGKVTLPVIFAREAARSDDEAQFWQRVMTDPASQTPEDFTRATALMARAGAISATIEAARHHAEAAKAALLHAPENAWRHALAALPDFVVHRVA
jgi:octaprenyl-diphosphate synthase